MTLRLIDDSFRGTWWKNGNRRAEFASAVFPPDKPKVATLNLLLIGYQNSSRPAGFEPTAFQTGITRQGPAPIRVLGDHRFKYSTTSRTEQERLFPPSYLASNLRRVSPIERKAPIKEFSKVITPASPVLYQSRL